jgi:hypothetical protein
MFSTLRPIIRSISSLLDPEEPDPEEPDPEEPDPEEPPPLVVDGLLGLYPFGKVILTVINAIPF